MAKTEVIIRLELMEEYSDEELKDVVKAYLLELILDESLSYEVVLNQGD